jgi:fructose 1,6-bisphosphatase
MMQSTHTIFPSLTKHAFLAQERERISKRATMTVMSANVLRWLGGLSTIPNERLEAGRAVLCRAQQDGALRDYRLYALGSDLVIQMITLGQGLHNSKVCELASDVVTTALTRAAEAHLYHPMLGEGDFFTSHHASASRRSVCDHWSSPSLSVGPSPSSLLRLLTGRLEPLTGCSSTCEAQVRNRTDEQGTAKIVAYTYQSYDNGRIPPEHDVVDLCAQDSVQTALLQHEAREAIQCMVQHEEFQPYVTAEEAERRARACAERLSRWFEIMPSAEEGEHDPLVQQANVRAGGETLSDIKADAGGKVGHTTPPTLFEYVARASLCESQEAGILRNFQVFSVGDDLHLLMSHSHGVDSNQIQLMAFQTFWRLVWVTELIGYKPYGLAQDLKIGPATKGARVDDLAQPSARSIELLATHLPEPEKSHLDR